MTDSTTTPTLDELIQLRIEDGIGHVTINRPKAKGALTGDMRDRLRDVFTDLSADLRVRSVLLRGEGGSFCSGADLRGGQVAAPRPDGAPTTATGEVTRLLDRGWQALIRAILDCDKPVVAAVEGVAAGGGFQLAIACDLVVAAEDARFIQAFVRRGIVPDAGAAYLLTRLVGPQKAKELLFLGDEVSGVEAHRLGIANRVVPADEVHKTAQDLARRLADGPTVSIAATKRLVGRALDTDRATALREEAMAQEIAMQSSDAKEGVAAFVERRSPDFTGW